MKNRKGFTLIEMIVVLVIIAILAAFAIPAVFRYIDEARNQKYVGDARMIYLGAQTVLTKAYGAGVTQADADTVVDEGVFVDGGNAVTNYKTQLEALTEDILTTTGNEYKVTVDAANYQKITLVEYFNAAAGVKVSMVPGGATVVETEQTGL